MRNYLVSVLLLLASTTVFGEISTLDRPSGTLMQHSSSPVYGTTDLGVVTIAARDFQPYSSTTAYNEDGEMNTFTTAGTAAMAAGFQVPTGARLLFAELQGCDTNAGVDINAAVTTRDEIGGLAFLMGASTTGTPGCGYFLAPFSPTPNFESFKVHAVYIFLGTDSSLKFSAVRIYYQRQVSPAPVTATFLDVPTNHPFFKFVEALSAAGITGGCGAGNYCPNSPVTRGQMAVFLATALGLHWPQ